MLGEAGPLPCTPIGCIELLRRHGVELNGAEVVVVGRGLTVGRPMGLLLTRRSENSTVTLCHTGTRDLAAHTRGADVIVAAAGVPDIITGDMVKPGAAVLDVGVSRVDGKIAGDLAADVWDVAGWVSPEPRRGGADDARHAALQHRVDGGAVGRGRALTSSPSVSDREAEPPEQPEETPSRRRTRSPRSWSRSPPSRTPGATPRRSAGSFYLVILGATVVGLGITWAGNWRLGVQWTAGALIVAALVRLVLPRRDAGMLAVRHRLFDCLLLGGVGALLIFLAQTIPDQPGL